MVGKAQRTRCANWLLALFFSSRSDSSFNFFVFFFIFFAQDVVFVLQAIGIPGWGFSGWIVSLSALKLNTGVAVLMMLVATQFTAVAGLGIIMLKRPCHAGDYRFRGAIVLQTFKRRRRSFY
ncbi:secretory carrier-associated membrane protein 3-like [Anolis sagrei]|uniref:secretory carrier-associated membrane protein 3-like n=1 Tax=Anolis sagrei TaxID=38937 RepID=UPI00352180BF